MNSKSNSDESLPGLDTPKKGRLNNVGIILIALLVTAFISLYFGMRVASEKMVKELCEKDGGLRVFETASISAKLYRQLAVKNNEISLPSKSTASPDNPFFTEVEEKILGQQPVQGGFPGIRRIETRYVQRDGNKTLATYVHYETKSFGDIRYVDQQCALTRESLTKQFIQVQS